MLRSAARVTSCCTLSASSKWCSSVAKTDETTPATPSEKRKQQFQAVKTQRTPFLTTFAVGGALGSVALFLYLQGDSAEEQKLKREIAERRAAGVKRADPTMLSKTVSDFLRFMEPESAPQFVALGISLAVYGLTDEAQQHERFPALRDLKDANAVMSWADFGAFVAYHALKEMGAPLVFVEPKFGRGEVEVERRQIKPFPKSDATFDEYLEWGRQFGLDAVETVAILGGQNAGSLLFTGAKERDITTSVYRRVVEATNQEELASIPFGTVLAANDLTTHCCYVFAQDHLYWNKYFVRGLVHILEAQWFHLRELPQRMSGTTTNAAWATRQKQVYGVSHDYVGSSAR